MRFYQLKHIRCNVYLENIGECMHCKEEQVSTVLGPCSHKIGKHCYEQIQKSSFTCPICNEKIEESINIGKKINTGCS